MEAINVLLNDDPNKWIETLDNYQKKTVLDLCELGDSPSVIAEKWLKYATANTYQFGAQKTSAILLNNVKKEVIKFLCGDPEYDQERKELAKNREVTRNYVIGLIASVISVKVGLSLVFLAPVVAIIIFSFGKCTLKAICTTLKELEE